MAWIVFPAVLVLLSAGWGLLLERVIGTRLPGVLVVPAGFASIVVIGQLLTLADATAELAAPAVVFAAILGGGPAIASRMRSAEPWALGCAVAVFVVYGAPVLLSGEATFAGYIKLDDTATWMAFTDRTMEFGRSLDGLAPSSYEATLDLNLAKGYPTAIFVPWGVGAAITGQDLAWVFQPYEALLAAMVALCLVSIATPVIASARMRALVALVASQGALLVGYAWWGGVKEVAGAMLVALVAALVPTALDGGRGPFLQRYSRSIGPTSTWRSVLPLALAAAALLGTLSVGAAVWLVPLLAPFIWTMLRAVGRREGLRRIALWAILAAVLVIPVLIVGGFLSPLTSSFLNDRALGNLLKPLSPLQGSGIWPSGDFRLDPDAPWLSYSLIALVGALAVAGIVVAVRARAWTPLLYAGGAIGGTAAIVAFGSPWAEAKALAIASPAVLLLALIAAVRLAESTRSPSGWNRRLPAIRVLGIAAMVAVGAGVIWSNALAYREVNLAPRDQLAELEAIGPIIAGEGPALMTEYQPYGVRHFLRDADPEGASELRRRQVLLRGGDVSKKGAWADTDELERDGLFVYRTLVLRRSPGQSRPPSPFTLVWEGEYYEVWQREPGASDDVLARMPLAERIEPAARPRCSDVRKLARVAGPDGRLAAATPASAEVTRLADAAIHPRAWEDDRYGPSTLLPRGAGTIETTLRVDAAGDWEAWLGGSVRGEVELLVDGDPVGSARHSLNNAGQFIGLGSVPLEPGAHEVTLRYGGADLHPGSGGQPLPFGPLVFSRLEAADAEVDYVSAANAESLCGRRWDWIEALA
jgi:hypothetical protein